MDSYQPIYDAVRSRISNGDIGAAVESAIRGANIAHHAEMCQRSIQQAAWEYERPCAVFRPACYPDGDQWCVLYGENIQAGVAGFGDTPEAAMRNFDENWRGQRLSRHGTGQREGDGT